MHLHREPMLAEAIAMERMHPQMSAKSMPQEPAPMRPQAEISRRRSIEPLVIRPAVLIVLWVLVYLGAASPPQYNPRVRDRAHRYDHERTRGISL
jgi:hypothetical protein